MRHRRFFDIIELLGSPVAWLQIEPSLVYFRRWVQKLFNCKGWKAIWSFGSRAALPILSIEYFFEKISTGTLVSEILNNILNLR